MKNLEENNNTISLVCDLLKVKFKEYSQKYCQAMNKKRNNIIQNIENNIKILSDKILNEHVKDKEDLKEKGDSAINELKIHLKYQTDRKHSRERAKWIEKGEKNTSCILGLEKRRLQDNVLEKIEIYGKFTENESETLGAIHSFYTNLYTTRNTENPKPSWTK